MLASATHRVLLRVAPAIPSPLHCRFDQIEPLLLGGIVGRRRQCQQLPLPVVADESHDRLPTRPAYVAIRARVVWVRSHQSLLDSKDKIVRGVKGSRWQWRIVAPETNL